MLRADGFYEQSVGGVGGIGSVGSFNQGTLALGTRHEERKENSF
jgi:hypothetical protein